MFTFRIYCYDWPSWSDYAYLVFVLVPFDFLGLSPKDASPSEVKWKARRDGQSAGAGNTVILESGLERHTRSPD
jgi:hypothetical protein